MSDQSTLGLGKIIASEQQRDAIHVAIAPVVASHLMAPGTHIGFTCGDRETVEAKPPQSGAIGIVDPFLIGMVHPGQRFWMLLYPGSITSLRHDWTHPAFGGPEQPPAPDSKQEAEKWLREFAERANLSYETVIAAGVNYIRDGDIHVEHDTERARDAIYEPGAREQYWKNFETVTGRTVSTGDRESHVFSCSC